MFKEQCTSKCKSKMALIILYLIKKKVMYEIVIFLVSITSGSQKKSLIQYRIGSLESLASSGVS